MTVNVYKAFGYAVLIGEGDDQCAAIKVVARADSDGAGATDLSIGVRVNGGRYLDGPRAQTTTKSNETLLLNTNPVTSGSWALADVNNVQLSLYSDSPPVAALAQDEEIIWSNQELLYARQTFTGESIGTLYIPFHVDREMTVRRMVIWNGAQVAGNISVGIYDRTTATRLTWSDVVTQAGTDRLQAIDITEYTLTPERYYMGIATSSNSAQLKVWRDAAGSTVPVLASGVKTEGVTTLPIVATMVDEGAASHQVPVIAIL